MNIGTLGFVSVLGCRGVSYGWDLMHLTTATLHIIYPATNLESLTQHPFSATH